MGEVKTKFVSIQPVEKADASNIAAAINRAMADQMGFDNPEDWLKKTVAFASDGAAVMTGKKTGVLTRLKGDRHFILAIHCFPHRLELAFKDAAKKVPLHSKIEAFLLQIYLFYHNSALNRANLKNSFETLGKKKLMPSRVGGTRWVSHMLRALDTFLESYPAIVQHLQQVFIFMQNLTS